MRTRLLVLTLTLACGAALAQESVRLNTPLPEPGQAVVQTQLKKPGEMGAARNDPPAQPASPATAPDARPMIPAAAPAQAASGTAPTLPPSATPSTGLMPGQPAKVYTTLAQARADGIDPLGEMKAIAPPPAPEAPPVGFDWRTPASWPDWARQNPKDAGLYGAGALAVLVLLGLAIRRRAPAED